jgi:predicted nucleic acid-binding protein
MAGNVLVDSSFYIERLRAGEDPFEEFAAHAEETDFFVCGVVMIEVLRGVKIKKAHTRLASLFATMLYVPTANHIWERSAELAWELDRQGKSMQVTDLIIATCALAADAAVLALDSDFARVPGLRAGFR